MPHILTQRYISDNDNNALHSLKVTLRYSIRHFGSVSSVVVYIVAYLGNLHFKIKISIIEGQLGGARGHLNGFNKVGIYLLKKYRNFNIL